MIVVRIRFHDWQESGIHRIRNFSEELWGDFRDDKRVVIDLGEIDQAVDEIKFSTRRSYLKTALKATKAMMLKHMVHDEADIVVEDPARPLA